MKAKENLEALRAVAYSVGALAVLYGVSEKEVDAYLTLVSAVLLLAALNVPLIKRLWQEILRTRSE